MGEAKEKRKDEQRFVAHKKTVPMRILKAALSLLLCAPVFMYFVFTHCYEENEYLWDMWSKK